MVTSRSGSAPDYCTDSNIFASIGVIFTIGKAVSDIGRATSPAKSKMTAMCADQFVQLQLKNVQIKKAIFRLV